MSDTILAHISKDGRRQELSDHLLGVSKLCREYCSNIGISEVGFVCGLAHDMGKASHSFQEYISGTTDYGRGDVDHSTAGAQYLSTLECKMIDLCNQSFPSSRYYMESVDLMKLCVLSHHSGLINCLTADGIDSFSKRIEKDLGNDGLESVLINMDPAILDLIQEHLPSAIEQLSAIIETIGFASADVKDKGRFRIGLLARFILSCLIDADHNDTRSFMSLSNHDVSKSPSWDELCSRFDDYNSRLNTEGDVNKIRCRISEQCLQSSSKSPGVYTLSVPTGGGKTLASLRFALNHAKKNGLDRIIYVIPYTSIIDQNARVIRSVLEKNGDKVVLEYHSNIDRSADDEDLSIWRYYSDSWDVKIVITTMVQYLNCMFASGSSNIKKMHNLSKSVLIFDEIQTLPIKCTHMFNESVNFLSSVCGSTALVYCNSTSVVKGEGLSPGNLFRSRDYRMFWNIER